MGPSVGPSLLVGTWFYDGWHRVTAVQVDLDAAWWLFQDHATRLKLSGGPTYQGWDFPLAPSFKAQVFVTRPARWSTSFGAGKIIDTIGVSLSFGFEFPFCRPPYLDQLGEMVDLNSPMGDSSREYQFQNDADIERARRQKKTP